MVQSLNSDGYLCLALRNDSGPVDFEVHRIVALTFNGEVEGKSQVNHEDGNKQNNHRTNLKWCTPRENIDHAIKTGLRDPFYKREKLLSNNKSGFIGVSFSNGRYIWKVTHKGDSKGGSSKSIEGAITARNNYIINNDLKEYFLVQEITKKGSKCS